MGRNLGPARRRGLTFGSLAAMLISLAAVVPPPGAHAATVTSATPNVALNQQWNAYGDAGGHWTGADSTASVLLPDGRIAWLYSDTFLGTVNADHSRARTTPMINNSIVVQQGSTFTTLTGGTAAAPESLVGPSSADEWRWVADGTVVGNNLQVFYNTYRRTGTGAWDFKLSGSELATFALPDLTLRGTVQLPVGSSVAWGMAVTEQSDYTYVYGTEMSSPTKYVHVARARTGQLWDPWEFWDGAAWTASEATSARLVSGVGSSFSVDLIDGRYLLVTKDDTLAFGPNVVAYFATSPTGPFTEQTFLYQAPEASGSQFVYDARLHPELSKPGRLVISYNVNSMAADDNYRDARIYRPRFIDVALSTAPPDPSTLPPAPGNLRATPGDGQATLQWDPAGAGLWYWIYRRDLTAKETQYARLPYPVAGATQVTVGGLLDGHQYEFQVSAINELGEGPRSASVALTATAIPAAVPAGLTATARTDGQIDLAWQAAARATYYWVYQRNVTDGETTFTRLNLPASGTTFTAGLLTHTHTYEFRVTAANGGGETAPSNTVQATSSYAKPGAPTGLTAVARGDASIALSWTAPGENLWYWIYQRDVTAGETTFTKLAYPATTTSATPGGLLVGHVYEYQVAAISAGGDGPNSASVQATAKLDVPGTPTGLTAVARGDASVALTWTAPGEDLWYWVYQRDVTAGETEFTKLAYPTTTPSATPGALLVGHVYEFKVAAINQGGDGPASAPVTVTARLDEPGAPTDLVAAAGAGKVTLTWSFAQTDAWFWVYTRDVTAGDTTFTRSGYPVADATTVTLGPLVNDHTYEFQVAAINQGGEGARSAVAAAKPVAVKPAAPTGLTAVAGTDGTVKLAWTASPGDNWYWAYWRDVTAGETTFTKAGYPVADATSVTVGPFTHNHTYEFKVSAVSGSGEGPAGATVSSLVRYAVPGAPQNVRAVVAGDGVVNLSWDAAAPQLYYWIHRRDVTAGETTFTKAGYPTDQTQITLSALTIGHTYEYKVSGQSTGGEGPQSAVASVVARGTVPSPPTALTATPGNGEVKLSWTASTTGSVYYWVELRDVTAGTGFKRLEYPVDGTSLTVKPLVNAHTYEFRVAATSTAGDSAPAAATAKPMPPLPGAPPVLNAIAIDGAVGLGWTAGSNATSYVVEYRDVTAGQSAWKRSKSVDGFAFTVQSLTNGHAYDFRVKPVNATGEGAASPTARATPLPALPAAPAGLSATAGNGQVKLSWSAASGADFYWVYYKAQGQTEWYYLKNPISGTSTTVKSLLNNFSYQFKVTAANPAGQGPASNVVSARPTAPLPAAPSGLSADAGDGQVKLSWTGASGADFYWVYYKAQGQTEWYYLKNPVKGTSTTVKSLYNNFSYQFKVTAANEAGQSGYSNTVTAKPMTPLPSAPTGVTGRIIDNSIYDFTTVLLEWNTKPGLYYWVYYRSAGGSTWTKWGYPTTAGSAQFAPQRKGDMEFMIRAENVSGLGPASDTVKLRLHSRTDVFRIVARWMATQMSINAKSTVVRDIYDFNQTTIGKIGAYALWARWVKPGADWDHKAILREILEAPYSEHPRVWTRVPTREELAILYDIWSNIHYGYVGCQAGFSRFELNLGQASPGAGADGYNFDKGDLLSVKLGYDMCDRSNKNVSPEALANVVINNVPIWQSYGGDRVKPWVEGMN
ncbi:DUF5005 domain-containing protein [Actinoplanes sp. NPDC049599]|uniref:DUF5005 domain-containing protein n=1 Tax=Actinoplanes sp. NPDC049599 TaxID=3363903 RepID=UPI0037BCB5EE